MFSKGTRVQVVDEEEARRTYANVYKGEKGTVIKDANGYTLVVTDTESDLGPWSIPVAGLRRIHCKKASVK